MDRTSTSLRDIVYLTVLNSNSPLDFTGHIGKISDFIKFKNFIYKINQWCNKNHFDKNLETITLENSDVLVKYKSSSWLNKMWTRAKVLYTNEETKVAQLFLIDEGILKIFSHEKIRLDIPHFYHDIEAQAKHFRLSSPTYESSLLKCKFEANKHFIELFMKYVCFHVKKIDKIKNKDSSLFYYSYITDLLIEDKNSLLEYLIDIDLIQVGHQNNNCKRILENSESCKNGRIHDNETDDGDGFTLIYNKVYRKIGE